MIVPDSDRSPSKSALYSNPDRRPPVLAPDPAGVPAEMRDAARWVLWSLTWKGRWTKLPLRADGTAASSTNPATWTDFAAAVAAYRGDPDRFAGVGFCLGGGWCGVDLDDVRCPSGRALLPWAAALVDRLGTYAERSPSGTGVKLFGRGTWAGGWHRRPHPGGGEVEVYDGRRFFAVTGRPLTDRPLADVTTGLAAALREIPKRPPAVTVAQPPRRGTADDGDLVRRAGACANGDRFRRLWAGDSAGYRSASEADLALCCILAYWADRDPARVDALFRQSGRMRPKWDEKRGQHTYGGRTVGEATRRTTITHADRAGGPPPDGGAVPGWERPPLPLPALSPVPAFPLEVLPAGAADYYAAAAESLNVPVDYVAVPGLTLLGAAVGRSRAASVKDGYDEPPCLWAMVVAPPGSTKSAALKLAGAPLWKAEERWQAEYAEAAAAYAIEVERFKAAEKEWKQGGCAGEPPARPAEPALRQALLDDATAEAVARVLRGNPRGVAVVKDELSEFVLGQNQYKGGHGADRQFWMKVWAGAAVKVNRVKDAAGLPLFVPHPFAAVAGMVCPEVLPLVRGDRRGGEAPQDGFIDRFLMSYPDPRPAEAEAFRTVPAHLAAGYCELVRALLTWDPVVTDGGGRRPYFVHFDACGRAAYQRFTGALAGRMNGLAADDPFRGVLSKLRGYGLKLAGLLWCLRRAAGELAQDAAIDADTMDRAAELVTYFTAHAARCLGVNVGDRTGRVARRLARWLAAHPRITAFTRTNAFQQLKDRRDMTTGAALDAPLALLADYGYVRPVAAEYGGRPGPAPQTFAVNPLWNRAREPEAAISGDSGDGFATGGGSGVSPAA